MSNDDHASSQSDAVTERQDVQRAGKQSHGGPSQARAALEGFMDAGQFLRHWAEGPKAIGAVSPSGRFLARAMAAPVPVNRAGKVIELGPGTGSVTKALLAHGISAERLVLIEYNAQFCELLRERFPGVTVIEGDAYSVRDTLAAHGIGQADACVSSLPLFTQPLERRISLLRAVASLLPRGAEFIQFSYALVPPVKACDCAELFQLKVSPWILRNIPPARVWRYKFIGLDS